MRKPILSADKLTKEQAVDLLNMYMKMSTMNENLNNVDLCMLQAVKYGVDALQKEIEKE